VSELGAQRHQSRERALEILYEASVKERSVLVVLNELPVRPDDYTVALVTSAEQNAEKANELISEYSLDWALDRIALIDRLVMTLAIGEMLLEETPPRAVILDEAVELAKIYSTDGSGSFVNGVLASIAEDIFS
jgi:transcription antitermination protein NusB